VKSSAKSMVTISHHTNANNIKANLKDCRWLQTETK